VKSRTGVLGLFPAVLIGLVWIAACTETTPDLVEVGDLDVLMAPPSQEPDPEPDAVDPDSAAQATVDTVQVLGSNFQPEDRVGWLLNGKGTDDIVTLSTEFVDDTQLTAVIEVAADAEVTTFDVEVRGGGKRKGRGTDLLRVVESPGNTSGPGQREDVPVDVTLSDAAGDNITSDLRFGTGTSTYASGSCGVGAAINGSGTQDMTMSTGGSGPPIKKQEEAACNGRDPRTIHFEFDDPVDGGAPGPSHPADLTAFLNVNDVGITTASVLVKAQFNISVCSRLVFDPSEFADTDPVLLTRVAPDRWTVSTTGDARARCDTEGRTYRMPFSLEIVSK